MPKSSDDSKKTLNIGEGFIPLTEKDIERSVNVPVRERKNIVTIEKQGRILPRKVSKKRVTKKKSSKKTSKKKSSKKVEDFGPAKRTKKALTDGYSLVITEKPQASAKIAEALADSRTLKKVSLPGGVYYFTLKHNKEDVVVACAVGHLFGLNQKPGTKGWPIFDVEWVPSFIRKGSAFTKKYYDVLRRLASGAKEFVVASVDYNEPTPILKDGELVIDKIGRLIDDIIENNRKLSRYKVPAFDEHGRISLRPLKKAIRHRINEELYEIKLSYGRTVKLTASHNVFILDKNKIRNIKTTNLKVGDKILCPANLSVPDKKSGEVNFLELSKYKASRNLFVEGKDVIEIIRNKIINGRRKTSPLNDKRIILTSSGLAKLKRLRIMKNLSTFTASKLSGLSQPSIVYWENGKRNPSKLKFSEYLSSLEVNPDDFLENGRYCVVGLSSFDNLLKHIYQNQFKNYSNLSRATVKLNELSEEDIHLINDAFIYGSKNRRNKLPVKIPVDIKFSRVLGYYLAEGDINQDYHIRFSLGLPGYGHEQIIIDEIKEFCQNYGINSNDYVHKTLGHQVLTIDNSVLAAAFKNILLFGKNAREKRVPRIIYSLSEDLKLEFLRAYFLGDGSLSKDSIAFNTSSEWLAYDLRYLLLQLGVISSVSKIEKPSGKGGGPSWRVIISGSYELKKLKNVWKSHHRSRILNTSGSYKKRNVMGHYGDLILLPIVDIKKVKSSNDYVYDFSVDGENFIAGNGGVCCHNTDYDVEGEVIGWNILRFICGVDDSKRLKFSSLTKNEVVKAYDNPSTTIDWGQAIAGETRHYLDWYYGINLSRALMDAIKNAGSFRIMSVGRVQGPALNIIVKKEKQILEFKPTPYWQVFIIIDLPEFKSNLELKYFKDITNKSELKRFELLRSSKAVAETLVKEQLLPTPAPFDLTTLQTEAYKFHGITPSQTLRVAQGLYLNGLISYPRTSSQKIPSEIDTSSILNNLKKVFPKELKSVTRKLPVEGKKSDPAHPAIHPTGELNGVNALDGQELKVYNLISKRFIAAFCDNAVLNNKTVTVTIPDFDDKARFVAKGVSIKSHGWLNVYPSKIDEKSVPDVNGNVDIKEVRIEEKETLPPRRYSAASLVSELSKKNLGTKATRANIIETLYDRGYIKERSIEATSMGISLIDTLQKHSPVIIDE
ncbi:hypothetical protein COU61_04555, partial [Candidatus Pacearchaeota archaeon CG10_big_fil_rev_8_21_14_0_10_35_13]